MCSGCQGALDVDAYPVFRAGCQGPIFAGARFEGATRQLITALKERDAWQLARPLGQQLGVAVAASVAQLRAGARTPPAGVVLVPVPSAKRAVRERGLDVTAVLAKTAADQLAGNGVRCRYLGALRQRRGVMDQSGLSAAGRRQNMAEGFTATRLGAERLLSSKAEGAVVLLVDDIVTTGSTLASAAHALTRRGISVDGFAVIAEKP